MSEIDVEDYIDDDTKSNAVSEKSKSGPIKTSVRLHVHNHLDYLIEYFFRKLVQD